MWSSPLPILAHFSLYYIGYIGFIQEILSTVGHGSPRHHECCCQDDDFHDDEGASLARYLTAARVRGLVVMMMMVIMMMVMVMVMMVMVMMKAHLWLVTSQQPA